MAWRRLIGRILIVALLAHAVAVVRHHILMLGVAGDAALAATLMPICHAGISKSDADKSNPGTVRKSCPICSGLAAAFTLPDPEPPLAPACIEAKDVLLVTWEAPRLTERRHARPPGRGPPSPLS